MWPSLFELLLLILVIALIGICVILMLMLQREITVGEHLLQLHDGGSTCLRPGNGFDVEMITNGDEEANVFLYFVVEELVKGYKFTDYNGVITNTEQLVGMRKGDTVELYSFTSLYRVSLATNGVYYVWEEPNGAGSLFLPQTPMCRFAYSVEEVPESIVETAVMQHAKENTVENLLHRFEKPVIETSTPLRVRCTTKDSHGTFMVNDVGMRASLVKIEESKEGEYAIEELPTSTALDTSSFASEGTVVIATAMFTGNTPTMDSIVLLGEALVMRGSWNSTAFYDELSDLTSSTLRSADASAMQLYSALRSQTENREHNPLAEEPKYAPP